MKIKEITWEHGNDFYADLICEHCGNIQKLSCGYHDNYFHTRVIPDIKCNRCGRDRDGKDNQSGKK